MAAALHATPVISKPILRLVTHFVDLAVELYQSYFVRMAL